VTKNYYLQETE